MKNYIRPLASLLLRQTMGVPCLETADIFEPVKDKEPGRAMTGGLKCRVKVNSRA